LLFGYSIVIAMLYRGGHAQQHVDAVGHRLPLHQFDILLAAQIPQDLPDAPPEPSVHHLATVFQKDHGPGSETALPG
jgi:hypothetical protein